MATGNKFTLALLQMPVKTSKAENLDTASKWIRDASHQGAQMVCLPECFVCPYRAEYFSRSAEPIPGETSEVLSRAARESQVYVVGGSMCESAQGNLYNTCLVYGPDGSMLAKHRKVHLFDISVPGVQLRESDYFAAGGALTTFDTPFCTAGIGICYDIRFAPMAQLYAEMGCELLLFPASWSVIGGARFWELVYKVRALDNQVYVAGVSAARDETSPFVAYGHSMLVDPLGKVVRSAGAQEEIVLVEVDLNHLSSLREQMPLATHRRDDLFQVVQCQPNKGAASSDVIREFS